MNALNQPSEPALQRLLTRPDIWQGWTPAWSGARGESTGFVRLDRQLPSGGWPEGALIELLPERPGIGELRLLMPALARLSQGARWVAWIDPPHVPHAAGLQSCGLDLTHTLVVHPRDAHERLWALEQALESGTCAAVLGWPGALDAKSSRRLQLAAEAGESRGFLFREPGGARSVSHAALRLALAPERGGLALTPLKHRGAWPGAPLALSAAELFGGTQERQAMASLTRLPDA
jgi:cell division inhibitor SulA